MTPTINIENIHVGTYFPRTFMRNGLITEKRHQDALAEIKDIIRREFAAEHIEGYGRRVRAATYRFPGRANIVVLRPTPQNLPANTSSWDVVLDGDDFEPTILRQLQFSDGNWQPHGDDTKCPTCKREARIRPEFFDQVISAMEVQDALANSDPKEKPKPKFLVAVAQNSPTFEHKKTILRIFNENEVADAFMVLVKANFSVEVAAELVGSAAHDLRVGWGLSMW